MDSLDPKVVGGLAKILVGGERAGWLSWQHLYDTALDSHEAANTHRDNIMQVISVVGGGGVGGDVGVGDVGDVGDVGGVGVGGVVIGIIGVGVGGVVIGIIGVRVLVLGVFMVLVMLVL